MELKDWPESARLRMGNFYLKRSRSTRVVTLYSCLLPFRFMYKLFSSGSSLSTVSMRFPMDENKNAQMIKSQKLNIRHKLSIQALNTHILRHNSSTTIARSNTLC